MRNSSQKAGCMRRLLRSPTGASHCCHDRMLVCTSAAAAAWVMPAASRAARTCSGVGLAEGPFGPLFGWLGIDRCDGDFAFLDRSDFAAGGVIGVPGITGHCVKGFGFGGAFVVADDNAGNCVFYTEGGHFLLQPLYPRRGGMKRSSHELNYTRIARKRKNFFEIFSRSMARRPSPLTLF